MILNPDFGYDPELDRDVSYDDASDSGFYDPIGTQGRDELYDEPVPYDAVEPMLSYAPDGEEAAPETRWAEEIADRYGLVPDWSDADNLSRHLYPSLPQNPASEDVLGEPAHPEEPAHPTTAGEPAHPTTAGEPAHPTTAGEPAHPESLGEDDDLVAINALSSFPSHFEEDSGDEAPDVTGSRHLQAIGSEEQLTPMAATNAEVERLITADVNRRFVRIPGNSLNSLYDKPERKFWTPRRERTWRYLNEGQEIAKGYLQKPFQPWMRGIPIPLLVPVFSVVGYRLCNDPNLRPSAKSIVSEMGFTSVVTPGQTLRMDWHTAREMRCLETIDQSRMTSFRHLNGRLFLGFRPDLYLHTTVRYLGHFKAVSVGSSAYRTFTLSGHGCHSLFPSHVFRRTDDYLNQRAGLLSKFSPPRRGFRMQHRRLYRDHRRFTLLDVMPAKLSSIHSLWRVPRLRPWLPPMEVNDLIYSTRTRLRRRYTRRRARRLAARQGVGTLFPDPRRRARGYRPIIAKRVGQEDRATRGERLNYVFHHSLTDGLGRHGGNRRTHYTVYNNVGLFRRLLSIHLEQPEAEWEDANAVEEQVIPEEFRLTQFLNDPYAPVTLPEDKRRRFPAFVRPYIRPYLHPVLPSWLRHIVDEPAERPKETAADLTFRDRLVDELFEGLWPVDERRSGSGDANVGKEIYILRKKRSRRRARRNLDLEKAWRRQLARAYRKGTPIDLLNNKTVGIASGSLDVDEWRTRFTPDTTVLLTYTGRLMDHLRLQPSAARLWRRNPHTSGLWALCYPPATDFGPARRWARCEIGGEPWTSRANRSLVGAPSPGSRDAAYKSRLANRERLRRGIVQGRSDGLARRHSGYFLPDATPEALNRYLTASYVDPIHPSRHGLVDRWFALGDGGSPSTGWANVRDAETTPATVWEPPHTNPNGGYDQPRVPDVIIEVHGPTAHLREAIRFAAQGIDILPGLIHYPSGGGWMSYDPAEYSEWGYSTTDTGYGVSHEWQPLLTTTIPLGDGPPYYADDRAAEERNLQALVVDTDRTRAHRTPEFAPRRDAPNRFALREMSGTPTWGEAYRNELRVAANSVPRTSYTYYTMGQLRKLGRLERMAKLAGLKNTRYGTVRRQVLSAGRVRDAAHGYGRRQARRLTALGTPGKNILATELAQTGWVDLNEAKHGDDHIDYVDAGTAQDNTPTPVRDHLSDDLIHHWQDPTPFWEDTAIIVEDEDDDEKAEDIILPAHLTWDWNSRRTIWEDREEEGFNTLGNLWNLETADYAHWANAHPLREPGTTDGRSSRQAVPTRRSEWQPINIRMDFGSRMSHGHTSEEPWKKAFGTGRAHDYGYDTAGGHRVPRRGLKGQFLQGGLRGWAYPEESFKANASSWETIQVDPLWIIAIQWYLFFRMVQWANRFQDRYLLGLYIWCFEWADTGRLWQSLVHVNAKDPLIVNVARTRLRRIVGGEATCASFAPTIGYLQRWKQWLNPIVAKPPTVDHHGVGFPSLGVGGDVEIAPRGILLVGPPGVGKTFLIRSLAGEAYVQAIVYGRERVVTRTSVGPRGEFQTALQLVNLFDMARQLTPCVVFIDEIDGLGPDRRRVSEANDGRTTTGKEVLTAGQDFVKLNAFVNWTDRLSYAHPSFNLIKTAGWHWRVTNPVLYNQAFAVRRPWTFRPEDKGSLDPRDERSGFENPPLTNVQMLTLGHLLTEIDGFNVQRNIVVGATNRPRALDPALVRPGRLSRVIFVDLPSHRKRVQLMESYSAGDYTEPIDWEYFARHTGGLSPAHLNAAMNFSRLRNAYNTVTVEPLSEVAPYNVARRRADAPAKHTSASVAYGLSRIGFRSPQNTHYRRVRDKLVDGAYPDRVGRVLTAGSRSILRHVPASPRGWVNLHSVAATGYVMFDSAPSALRERLLTRENLLWEYIRTSLTRVRLASVVDEGDDAPQMRSPSALPAERIRRLMELISSSRHTPAPLSERNRADVDKLPEENLSLRALRLRQRDAFYKKHAESIHRMLAMTSIQRDRAVGSDPVPYIERWLGSPEDAPSVRAIASYFRFGDRILRHHIFGSTMLQHSSYALHDIVSPRVTPVLDVRQDQLVESGVQFNRFAGLAALTPTLTATSGRDGATIFGNIVGVGGVQRRTLGDAYATQRLAYHHASVALVRSRVRSGDGLRRYRLWSLTRNVELPLSEREFANDIRKHCSTKAQFEAGLAGLVAGRVGERLFMVARNQGASDVGREDSRRSGWMLNIMIENNLFYRSTFPFLKQFAVEPFRQRKEKPTERLKEGLMYHVMNTVRTRFDGEDTSLRAVTRSGDVSRRPHHGALAAEPWWIYHTARHRRRKIGERYDRLWRRVDETEIEPYYPRKWFVNAPWDKAGLTVSDRSAVGRAYDSFVQDFLGCSRASFNQQMLSESESLRTQVLFEVYEQLLAYLEDQRQGVLLDYVMFQLMTHGELDDAQIQAMISRVLEVQDLDRNVAQEWIIFEQKVSAAANTGLIDTVATGTTDATDAGTIDAGTTDAGTTDAGANEATDADVSSYLPRPASTVDNDVMSQLFDDDPPSPTDDPPSSTDDPPSLDSLYDDPPSSDDLS